MNILETRNAHLPNVRKNMVKRIKAVYEHDRLKRLQFEQPRKTLEYLNKGSQVMTGQEFADRMEAELKAYPSDEPYPTYVHEVIRRAAGLDT
jgi:hypothetical protein